ncbi:hypothetical protein KIW84_050954 [Lathyrus oleraceus]|uniref:Uncharacterized protein n=1 Tax=Pisum sativum TaxID=3888 RepID=A0A9D4WIT4_PEA|nr:hypothetical protein KIW84_050954 [Pisum sativum]
MTGYKIQIEVVHCVSCSKFILWDRESEQLLGLSAAQMRSTVIEDGITDPLEYPLTLEKLLGKEIAFKVKWKPHWDNSSVVSILRDTAVIEQLKAPWERDNVQQTLSLFLQKSSLSSMETTKTMPLKSGIGKNSIAFTIPPDTDEEGKYYIPEPPLSKEKIVIWAKQVHIPLSLSNKLFFSISNYEVERWETCTLLPKLLSHNAFSV